jgi:hypothetical protein
MQVPGQRDLLHLVGAARSPGRFAGRLHSGQQECHENANDGDYHQQLNERETM